MNKFINKYAVIIISILLADLISTYVLGWLHGYSNTTMPYYSSALSMMVVVIIFYPMLLFLEKYLKQMSSNWIKHGGKWIGNLFVGQIVGFLMALFLIWLGYAHALYHVKPWSVINNWLAINF